MTDGCPDIGQVYGCAASPPGNLQYWIDNAKSVDVVIVGGGIAGLSAARKLLVLGVTSLVVLEAQEDVGGRVSTYREGNIRVEDGAQWIHGGQLNPLHKIALEHNAILEDPPDDQYDSAIVDVAKRKRIKDDRNLYKVEGLILAVEEEGLEPYYQTGYGQYFIDKLPSEFGSSWGSAKSKAWVHYLEQRVNGEEGTNSWLDISARDADAFADYGDDYEWKDGYDTLIKYLTQDIPSDLIQTSTPVSSITTCANGSRNSDVGTTLVVTSNGSSYIAKYVLSTVSIAYLKKHHKCMFFPNLPTSLTSLFQDIKLGTPNKIYIGWPDRWWGNLLMDFYVLWTEFSLPQEMTWLYGISNVISTINNEAVVEMFVSGNYSKHMEDLDEETVKSHVVHFMGLLTQSEIPEPTFFRRTTWSKNEYTLGSYSSYITPQGSREGLYSREPFRVPIKNAFGEEVIYWAGEHTSDDRYGTVDGAYSSGEREAVRISNKLQCCAKSANAAMLTSSSGYIRSVFTTFIAWVVVVVNKFTGIN